MIGKKGILEVLVRSGNGLYEGMKTRVRQDCELGLEESELKVGMHQGIAFSHSSYSCRRCR